MDTQEKVLHDWYDLLVVTLIRIEQARHACGMPHCPAGEYRPAGEGSRRSFYWRRMKAFSVEMK